MAIVLEVLYDVAVEYQRVQALLNMYNGFLLDFIAYNSSKAYCLIFGRGKVKK